MKSEKKVREKERENTIVRKKKLKSKGAQTS